MTFDPSKRSKTHQIPIGTLVEINFPDNPGNGLRLYVINHRYDFDGTPIYSLHHTISMDTVETPYAYSRGWVEDYLKIIKTKDEISWDEEAEEYFRYES